MEQIKDSITLSEVVKEARERYPDYINKETALIEYTKLCVTVSRVHPELEIWVSRICILTLFLDIRVN